jgi:hypothetical protein
VTAEADGARADRLKHAGPAIAQGSHGLVAICDENDQIAVAIQIANHRREGIR